MTCDTCYKPLVNIGRHNRYYFCKIVEFERISKHDFIQNQAKYNNPREIRFNYDTSQWSKYHDYVYCYKFDSYPTANGYSTWFCCKECALQAAVRMNMILFYFDENDNSVAMLVPQLKEINKEIEEAPLTPLLMMDWPANKWYQQPSDFQDLSKYGLETKFPEISFSKTNLIQPNRMMVPQLQKMFATPSFAKNYFGSSSSSIIERLKNQIPDNFDESARIDFGRRAEISWYITDKFNNFIGFIHFTQKYPALPYKWVIEFGLIPSQQNKGIMSEIVPELIKWARREGCDEPIYAISEEYNHACHSILRRLPHTQEFKQIMNDQYAGTRMMHIFVIN